MSDDPTGRPVPVVLAMVLCDAIHQDPATKKCTLLGTFSTISSRNYPVTHPRMGVHLALTNGHGKTTIRLSLVGLDETAPALFNNQGTIDFRDPRAVVELNFGLGNLNFPTPGEYRVQVYGNEQLLAERRLYLMHIQQGPPPTGPGKQDWEFNT
jgi:hypothetical protein